MNEGSVPVHNPILFSDYRAINPVVTQFEGSDPRTAEPVLELRNTRVPYRERTRDGVASMPGREHTLALVLERVAPQVDEVFVYLNDIDAVPRECANAPLNVRFYTGPDLGDRGKFMFIENFRGYYITVDDDILYPDYYVSNLIAGIERYHRRAIVGWHGSVIKDDIETYYRSKSRKVYSYLHSLKEDTPVHILGTGTTAFHTDTLRVQQHDFPHPNMADVFLALVARRYGIHMVALAHEGNAATPLETADSISAVSLGNQESARSHRLDMASKVTRIVKEHVPWPKLDALATSAVDRFRVGILDLSESAAGSPTSMPNLTAQIRQLLLAQNCAIEELRPGTEQQIDSTNLDLAILHLSSTSSVCQGAQEQTDHLLALRIPVLILAPEKRPGDLKSFINKLVRTHSNKGSGLIGGITTYSSGLADPSGPHPIIEVPEVFTSLAAPEAEYGSSQGIFVCGISDSTVAPDLEDGSLHLRKLRAAVPEATLVTSYSEIQHYEPKLHLDEIWESPPELSTLENRISPRLLVSLPEVEATSHWPTYYSARGVPVLFATSDDLLARDLGNAGVHYRDPAELASKARLIYRSSSLWRQLSQAALRVSKSRGFDVASAQFYLSVRSFARTTTAGSM